MIVDNFRFDGRLLLEDISPYVSKGSSDSDNTWQLSYDEQEIERLCDEERYKDLENTNGSDDEYEGMLQSPVKTLKMTGQWLWKRKSRQDFWRNGSDLLNKLLRNFRLLLH